MIYLDNSATTPLSAEVSARMNRLRAESFANASSAHRAGQAARVVLEEARDRIARMIGAQPKELVFTSGGTESNNLALKGYALKVYMASGVWPALLVPRSEHHAVLHPTEFLARMGAPTRFLDVTAEGRLDPDALREALTEFTGGPPPLVSAMHANNETGTINPIAELAAVAHEMGAAFHTDAVQSFGKMPVRTDELGADMITLSAHKLHGPKGIGALYVNRAIELEPHAHGGAQERNRRGGTEPMELVAGFDEAAMIAARDREAVIADMGRQTALLRELLGAIEGIRFVTPAHGTLPNIVNVTFADAARLDGEALIVGMDLEGVAVSNGSACTSGSLQPSHVLAAMGLPPEQAKAAVRFSTSRYTTDDDIRAAAAALARVVGRMRKEG